MDWPLVAWFVVTLVPLLFVERWIHRHLQGVALLLVNDPEVAAWLYALPLLPGVLLHEASHALMGWLAGVRVGRLSILPAREGGRIQLGFVPVEATGVVQTALIGAAPLVVGCLALLAIGRFGLGMGPTGAMLAAGDWQTALERLTQVVHVRDVWVWVYLAFAVSNTMLPSRSDMRAWPVALLFLLGVIGLVAALGWGPALAGALRWLAVACALTLLVDLPFVLFILGAEWGLGRVRGLRVEYR